MTQEDAKAIEWQTPSATVARRVRELRDRRGWSAQQLAGRCAEAGADDLDRTRIANIESRRRRNVSIDEVLVLAHALDVAPVHLFVPVEEKWLAVTPKWIVGAGRVREWVRGRYPLPSRDSRRYWTEVPDHEWDAAEAARRARPQSTPEEIKAFLEQQGGEIHYVPRNSERE
jgi:transcriptional regulator with XRE-family HTH domain